jgi:hypothetical protein
MKRAIAAAIVICACLTALAQDAAPARDGLDLAQLPGTVVLRATPDGAVATVTLEGAKASARIWVEDDATAARARLAEVVAGASGKLDKLPRGDAAFGAGGVIAFVRANVCALVRGEPDLSDTLAGRIDDLVLASPVISADHPRSAPAIGSLKPSSMGAHKAMIAVEAKAAARLEAKATPAALVDVHDASLLLRAPKAGTYRVTVHAVSARGWRVSRTVDVTVE